MKLHTTNYFNTFIEVAEDTPATFGEIPPDKKDIKSVASMQFEIVYNNPYKYSSDDIFFMVYCSRNDITDEESEYAREIFFSKGQPCFRASPLTKRYGWGVHSNDSGKIAIYGMETGEYKKFASDSSLRVIKAMKSGK